MALTNETQVAHKAASADLRATDIGVTVMATVFVALRFASRWVRRVAIGPDDWLILGSLVSYRSRDASIA
jgi:hypothetical protein